MSLAAIFVRMRSMSMDKNKLIFIIVVLFSSSPLSECGGGWFVYLMAKRNIHDLE